MANSPQLSVAVIRDLQALLSRLREEEQGGTDDGTEVVGDGPNARPELLVQRIAARAAAMLRDIGGAERHLEELISGTAVLKRNLKKQKKENGRLRDAACGNLLSFSFLFSSTSVCSICHARAT